MTTRPSSIDLCNRRYARWCPSVSWMCLPYLWHFCWLLMCFFRSGELNSHPMESRATSTAALRYNAVPSAAKLQRFVSGCYDTTEWALGRLYATSKTCHLGPLQQYPISGDQMLLQRPMWPALEQQKEWWGLFSKTKTGT